MLENISDLAFTSSSSDCSDFSGLMGSSDRQHRDPNERHKHKQLADVSYLTRLSLC